MKDRLQSLDLQVWFYGLLVPDTTKVMYKDGNRLGTKAKLDYKSNYDDEINRRIDSIADGTAEYLPDDYLSKLIERNKSERISNLVSEWTALIYKQSRLSKYGKDLPNRQASRLLDLHQQLLHGGSTTLSDDT